VSVFLDLFLEASIILCRYLLILNEGITGSQYKIMHDLGDIQNILAQLLKLFFAGTDKNILMVNNFARL